ncbi:hypothetical protein TELCIR_17959 [Teladorsagia circumcincta]|uniref:Thioesterase domain-containing protein n=1 Tax=Teladorsagia circumcincta TaxID=45464 RepID=A0A2G9TSU4_TELCI|nr:hypothetical protein TELCIR_17959 [Teladorsagia circumcincta]
MSFMYIGFCAKSYVVASSTHMRPISASEGRVKVEFEVTPAMTNPWGGLHGGCTATLVDVVTTAACLVTPRGKPGVSVDLHVT